MGFRVCTLAKVPSKGYDYYLYLGGRGTAKQLKWLEKNFARLAREIGPNGAIVQGHDLQLSDDLHKILELRGATDIGSLFDSTLNAVVSQGPVERNRGNVYIVPLAAESVESLDAEEFAESIMNQLVDAIRRGSISTLMDDLGAHTIELKNAKFPMILTTFQKANEIVNLKPSIFGIGVNINAIVTKFLDSIERRYHI